MPISTMPKAAAIQMNSSHIVDDNLKTVEHLVTEAKKQGAVIAVLPENVAIMGFKETDKWEVAEPLGTGHIQQFFSNLAFRLQIWIIAGSLPILPSGGESKRVFSSSIIWNDRGERVAQYNKIHLFDVQVDSKETHQESRSIIPGDEKNLVTLDSPIGTIGLSICYDLRFPELYRNLSKAGAQIFTVPSAFTYITGEAHWEVLLRARAIENFCYVIAPGQTGTHTNGRKTYGHSMIIGPWGDILASIPEGEGVITCEIDLEKLNDIRNRLPAQNHRRIF